MHLPLIALAEIGVPLALLMFNVGVETGQLLFIAAVLGLLALGRRLPMTAPRGAWRVAPYTIGGVAAFWVMERVALIFPV